MTKEYKELKELLIECDPLQTNIKDLHTFDNTWVRRFFRCYLDGSYNGYEHYKSNCELLKACNGNVKKLRSFIVPQFINFLMVEFSDLSEYKIRKTIKESFNYSKDNKTNLELFNDLLIDDALDLIK